MKTKNIKIDISKINPAKLNELTEVEAGYKLLSINLVDLYNGLHPASLSKLSHVLFSCIMYNKMYRKQESKWYSEDEAKRVFTSILVQPTDLAKRIHPAKYASGANDIGNDLSNLLKRLDELEELNIFYMWRHKQPYTYIFVMERDVSSWKYYNPKGHLYPKSLKKILRLAKSMIETMKSLETQRERTIENNEIENSFGEFINKLLGKMGEEVSNKLPRWTNTGNIFSYISDLLGELKTIEDHFGCIYDEMFIGRLPEHIQNRVFKTNKEAIMNIEQLEMDLVPSNSNLVKTRTINKTAKKQKPNPVHNEEVYAPDKHEVKMLDPFKNPTEFTKYYRTFLRLYNASTKFYDFNYEVLTAGAVLDILLINGKHNNMKFLKAWIRFYIANSLKGNNVFKEDKTSIKEFLTTFNAYNKIYIG